MAVEKLYEGNIRKKYVFYTIPLILTTLLNHSYTLINAMMIGKFLGSGAFAATSATGPLIDFFSSALWGYHTGVAIYVAILFGKSDYGKMLNVIKMNLLIMSAFSILTGLCCNIFYKPIFNLLNISPELSPNAYAYFGTYMMGIVVLQMNWAFSYIAHGLGVTKLPLLASFFSGILNVLGNYIFLSVMDLGVQGCALSTIISSAAVCTIYVVSYVRIFHSMGVRLRGFSWDIPELKKSIGYALPTTTQQLAMTAGTAIISPLINTCGTAAIAGYDIAAKARNILVHIYQSSNKAITNFIAQAMGAKKIEKIHQGIKIGITQTMCFFLPVMVAFIIFARPFVELFLDTAKDEASINYSVNIIRFLLPFITFNVLNNMFHGIFRATGSGMLMLISTAIYSVAMIISSYTMYFLVSESFRLYGVYIGFAIAWITEATFAAIVFASGRWKSEEYKKMEAERKMRTNAV